MAYTPNTLAMRYGGFVEGTFNVWEYTTADALSAVLASGYFTDGSSKGMLVGDLVWIVNQTAPSGTNPGTPSVTLTQCSVSTVTTTGGLTQHVGSSTVIGAQNSSFYSNPRNMLDGGDATINPWQRGTSLTSLGATSATYTADRWFLFQSVSATSAAMVKTANSSVVGFSSLFAWGRTQSSGSVSTLFLGQVLESQDSFRAQGQNVTLSFWASFNTGFTAGQTSATIGVQLVQGFGIDQSANSCVAGTWTTQTNLVSATQVLTSTMTRYAFSATVSNTANQLGVLFSYIPNTTTAITAETVFMNGMQLEVGGMGPFEHREIEQEIAFCQRYYFEIDEPGTSGTVIAAGMVGPANSGLFVLNLPVQMRGVPTVSVTNGSFGANIGGAYVALTSIAGFGGHTVNYVGVSGLLTAVSNVPALLISSSAATGKIKISADL